MDDIGTYIKIKLLTIEDKITTSDYTTIYYISKTNDETKNYAMCAFYR